MNYQKEQFGKRNFEIYCFVCCFSMQIFVKTLTGKKTEFNVEEDSTVLALKTQLQEKEGIAVDQIRLLFNGKQLNDQDKLSEKGIKGMLLQMGR